MENSVLLQRPWELQEEEYEELEEGLTTRTKNLKQTSINADFHNNGELQLQEDEDEEKIKDFDQQNGIKIHEDDEEEVKDFGQQNGIKIHEDDEQEVKDFGQQNSIHEDDEEEVKDLGQQNGIKIHEQEVKHFGQQNSIHEDDEEEVKDFGHQNSIKIHEDDEEEVKDFGQQNGIKVHEDEDEEKKKKEQQRSEYCVYYDTDKGICKCRICPWDYEGRTCLTDHTQGLKRHSLMLGNEKNIYRKRSCSFNGQIGNGLHFESSALKANSVNYSNINVKAQNQDNENGEHLKHDKEVDESLVSYRNNKTEKTEIEVIKDSDDEVNEYDVETVLKKQDTHDLYCPNCNSCITKRVILRKRKRRIRIHGDDAKRNKPESTIPSEANVVSDDSNNDQALNGVDLGLNNAERDEYDHGREPDVFRCLSCFSIFMPTGNGFKLFRMFGNKSDEPSKKEVRVKKGWFSSIFASDKMEPLNNQANQTTSADSGVVESLDNNNNNNNNNNNVSGVSVVSSNLHEPNGEVTLTKEDKSRATNGMMSLEDKPAVGSVLPSGLNESKGHILDTPSVGGNDNVASSTPGYDTVEQQVVDESENAIKRNNGGIAFAMNSPEADNDDQLLTSYHIESNGKSDYAGTFVVNPPFNSMEPAENAVSPFQHDALKLLIPPNVGSLVIDNSQMNQKLDVTVQSKSPGISPEVSQQCIVQNNVEIDLQEPLLKVDKDILTDKQIKLHKDFKNIKSTTGNDVIITIESRPRDASSLQRSPDTIGVTGAPALQHVESAVEGGGTMTATEGRSLDVIKSIVYGGLMESIASLSVVSSAAGADAATLNVLALGLANIFGGLFVISHDLWDLKNERTKGSYDEAPYQEDRYQQLLGRKADFPLHMFVSILSYLVFGLLPPLVYGFSFRPSNDKDLKLLMVAAASVLCIMILAAGKAYVQRPCKSYLKTIAYYVAFGFMVSGVSFLFGDLIMKLLEKLDIFHSGLVANLNVYGASSNPALATN